MPLAIYLQRKDPARSGGGCEQWMECPSEGNSGRLEIPQDTLGALPCESPARQETERPEQTGVVRFLRALGPGLITGASDDDPSGIGTYAMAGASFGYATLWTALVTFPLMTVVQFTCAKIGMVTGRGLAGVLRRHYPRALLYPVVFALLLAN